jgi:hypothetical protein
MKGSLIVVSVLAGALVGGVSTPPVPPERGASSTGSLRMSVDAALDRGDHSAALRAAQVAKRRASREGRWEGLIEVGDAYYRIADRTGAPEAAADEAREAYRAALQSARRAESLDGVLRAAEAFARLGDASDVQLSLGVARNLAGSDAEAVDDVRAMGERLGDLLEAARSEDRGERLTDRGE